MQPETFRISIDIPTYIHRNLKVYCAMNELTIREMMTDVIIEYLERHKGESKIERR